MQPSKSGKDGFFTDIAAVRRILTEPRDVEFVDLAYLLANVIFLAEILRFFQFSVGEEHGHAVMAIALSPSVSCAAFSKNVESTPPEKATATLPKVTDGFPEVFCIFFQV